MFRQKRVSPFVPVVAGTLALLYAPYHWHQTMLIKSEIQHANSEVIGFDNFLHRTQITFQASTKTVTATVNSAKSYQRRYKVGEHLPVVYQRSNPDNFQIGVDVAPGREAAIIVIGSILLLCLGLYKRRTMS